MTTPFTEMRPASAMEDKYRDLVSAVQGLWGTDANVAPSLPKGLKYQYWKQCDRERCRTHYNKHLGYNPQRGWVTIGCTLESAPMEHAEMINQKHMTPLAIYGWSGTGEMSEIVNPKSRWNMILMKGGLIEFPRDQIIAYGWDKEQIVRSLRPDVVGVKRFECPHGCSGRDWAIDELGVSDAYKTHVKVVHPTVEGPKATADALSGVMEQFAKTMSSSGTPAAGIDAGTIAAIVAATVAALESRRESPAASVKDFTPAEAPTGEPVVRRGRPKSGKIPVIARSTARVIDPVIPTLSEEVVADNV